MKCCLIQIFWLFFLFDFLSNFQKSSKSGQITSKQRPSRSIGKKNYNVEKLQEEAEMKALKNCLETGSDEEPESGTDVEDMDCESGYETDVKLSKKDIKRFGKVSFSIDLYPIF